MKLKSLDASCEVIKLKHSDFSRNKSNDYFINNNSRFINDSHKNKIKTNKELTNYPSRLLKNDILKFFPKNKNKSHEIKKIDASTQKNFYLKTKSRIKSNILKNLIENFQEKNKNEIDYVLESPHRGLEKIQYSSPESNKYIKHKNLFSPIFVNNTYKGYFCKNYEKNNLSNLLGNDTNKKIFIDKYEEIKKNKEIDNPLKKLSQLSGISCYKLRQVINYSLNNKLKNKFNFLYKDKQNKNKKAILDNNRYKNDFKKIYSFITLKSKKNRNHQIIKDYSLENDNLNFNEFIIYPKKFKEIKLFSDLSKNDNDIIDL